MKTPSVLEEIDGAKPVKNIRVMKEKAKIVDQGTIEDFDDEEIEISPQKYINVISLCPYQLNLSTLPGGRGKVFTFNGFGETKRIMYQHLVDVMEASPRFLEEGWYYVADKKVIRRHGLVPIYDKLLTKQAIEGIFNKTLSPDEAADLYKSANSSQKTFIIDLIASKMTTGADFDMNLVSAISKVSGIDLVKKIEEGKFYTQTGQPMA